MKKEELVHISDYYVNENTRDTMISSRHNPIIRGLENASDEQILEIKNQYIQYEEEYAKPVNRIKRMVKRIIRK